MSMPANANAPRRTATPPKRILIVQTQAENAGAQAIAREIGDGLAARGHRVRHLFFFRASQSFELKYDSALVVETRPGSPLRFARFLRDLHRAIRADGPDVVLCFQHYGNMIAGPAARLAGVPLVVANQVSPRIHHDRFVRTVDRALASLGTYDAITVNSPDLMGAFAGHPKRYRDRITLIPHGLAIKTLGDDAGAARASFGLPPNAPVIGCTARLHPVKRIDRAIRLLPRLPEVHLAVAGSGPVEGELKALADDLGVADRFHRVGEIAPDAVGRFLTALDVFVFPTAAETFGLAVVEAAQAGVPVVASDIPIMREVLSLDDEPMARFVDTDDTEAFAAEVRALLDDPTTARTQAERGRRLAERFSLDAMFDAYERLIA